MSKELLEIISKETIEHVMGYAIGNVMKFHDQVCTALRETYNGCKLSLITPSADSSPIFVVYKEIVNVDGKKIIYEEELNKRLNGRGMHLSGPI